MVDGRMVMGMLVRMMVRMMVRMEVGMLMWNVVDF